MSVLNSEQQAERKRIEEIDSIASVINDAELVNEAKYGNAQKGIIPYSAAELAYKSAQKRAEGLAYADVDAGVQAASGTKYQKAMMMLGAHHTKKILEQNGSQSACPIANASAEQEARFMEGRKVARALLDPEEANSQSYTRDAAPSPQGSCPASISTTIPQVAAHTSTTRQGTDSIERESSSAGERQSVPKESGSIVSRTGPLGPAVQTIRRSPMIQHAFLAVSHRHLLPRIY